VAHGPDGATWREQACNLALLAPRITDVTLLDTALSHVVNCTAEILDRAYTRPIATFRVALIDEAGLDMPRALEARRFILHCAEERSRNTPDEPGGRSGLARGATNDCMPAPRIRRPATDKNARRVYNIQDVHTKTVSLKTQISPHTVRGHCRSSFSLCHERCARSAAARGASNKQDKKTS
jgi:hypothetical protein